MFAVFETLEAYQAKNAEINAHRGYPNEHCQSYASDSPVTTKDGRYAMGISLDLMHLFADCLIVDSVEYPDEVPEL